MARVLSAALDDAAAERLFIFIDGSLGETNDLYTMQCSTTLTDKQYECVAWKGCGMEGLHHSSMVLTQLPGVCRS